MLLFKSIIVLVYRLCTLPVKMLYNKAFSTLNDIIFSLFYRDLETITLIEKQFKFIPHIQHPEIQIRSQHQPWALWPE